MAEDIEVDARGLLCPLPVLKLAKALAGEPSGRVAVLRSTDPVAVRDVDLFCRDQGCVLLETSRDGAAYVFRVRKG